eukprot:14428136-Alexandrium_andersonii.AAC.1
MSASLVGSEMCIRDSLPPPAVPGAPFPHGRGGPRAPRPRCCRGRPGGGLACPGRGTAGLRLV